MSASLLERIATAEAWRPEIGQRLEGYFVAVQPRTTEFGTYPCVLIDENVEGGRLTAVHAFHQTVKDGIKELRPQPGDPILIIYLGEKESQKRKDPKTGEPAKYHHYVVLNPNDEPDTATEVNWDDVPGF